MNTILSSFVRRLAVLCAGLVLVACGGESGTIDDQTIPAGAQVCELKDYVWSHPGRPPSNLRFDSEYFPIFIDYSDSGKQFALTRLTTGYYYASIISDTLVILDGMVNDVLYVPTDRVTKVQLYYMLGAFAGQAVRGDEYQDVILGSGYNYIKRDEVTGITPATELPLVLSVPIVTEVQHRQFELSVPSYRLDDWSRLGATIDISVETIATGVENTASRQQRCELKGLAVGETVVVTGGLDGDTYIVQARSHASLDNSIEAYSKTVYQRLVY